MFPHVSRDDYSMTLTEAAAYIESVTGQRPASANMYRWVQDGVGGVKLEALKLGGRYFTGRNAVDHFLVSTQQSSTVRRVARPAPLMVKGLHSRVSGRRPAAEGQGSSAGHEAAMQFLDQRLGLFKFLLCC